jgi:hypothetical protein
MEYDSAVKQGIDILPFMLAEDTAWPRKFDELGPVNAIVSHP